MLFIFETSGPQVNKTHITHFVTLRNVFEFIILSDIYGDSVLLTVRIGGIFTGFRFSMSTSKYK